jgi:hypothetical protein
MQCAKAAHCICRLGPDAPGAGAARPEPGADLGDRDAAEGLASRMPGRDANAIPDPRRRTREILAVRAPVLATKDVAIQQ